MIRPVHMLSGAAVMLADSLCQACNGALWAALVSAWVAAGLLGACAWLQKP